VVWSVEELPPQPQRAAASARTASDELRGRSRTVPHFQGPSSTANWRACDYCTGIAVRRSGRPSRLSLFIWSLRAGRSCVPLREISRRSAQDDILCGGEGFASNGYRLIHIQVEIVEVVSVEFAITSGSKFPSTRFSRLKCGAVDADELHPHLQEDFQKRAIPAGGRGTSWLCGTRAVRDGGDRPAYLWIYRGVSGPRNGLRGCVLPRRGTRRS
jgi:hypothetical protein